MASPAKATLTLYKPNGTDLDESVKVTADFNPQTLRLTFRTHGATGTSSTQGSRETQAQRSQATNYTDELSVELLFDNSLDGKNVRAKTMVLEKMVKSVIKEQPPLVRFHWGDLLFRGTIQSLTETIDLFSEDGVPLRSTVSLSLAGNREEQRAAGAAAGSSATPPGAALGVSAGAGVGLSASAGVGVSAGVSASMSASAGIAVGTTPLTLSQSGDTLQSLAGRAGVDWKVAASANNIDNPRQVPPGTIIDLKAGTTRGS